MRSHLPLLFALVLTGAGSSAVMARTLSIVAGPDLPLPARHGLAKFEAAVRAQNWEIDEAASAKAARGDVIVLAVLADSLKTLPSLPALAHPLNVPEALAVKKFSLDGKPAILFAGADARGLMYALLDAAESVADAKDPSDLLDAIREIEEQPTIRDRALSVYTMNRAYWESRFYNEDYWKRYFDTLAANRFNRFLIVLATRTAGSSRRRIPTSSTRRSFPEFTWSALLPNSSTAISRR